MRPVAFEQYQQPDLQPDQQSDQSCITCGDVAVEVTVVAMVGNDAWCEGPDGTQERVAVDLVEGVRIGDRLVVHAAVALVNVGSR